MSYQEEQRFIVGREETDLMIDPFSISIISNMTEKPVTAEWLAKDLDEPLTLVCDYLERLHHLNLLLKEEKDGESYYSRLAGSYTFASYSLPAEESIHNHWLFGVIHHLEGDYMDLLRVLKEKSDISRLTESLEELGYDDLHISTGRISLRKGKLKELKELIYQFIDEQKKEGEEEEEEDRRYYDITLFIKPNLPDLRQIIKKNKK